METVKKQSQSERPSYIAARKRNLTAHMKRISTKEIAGQVHLSTKTVENHHDHLLEKLLPNTAKPHVPVAQLRYQHIVNTAKCRIIFDA